MDYDASNLFQLYNEKTGEPAPLFCGISEEQLVVLVEEVQRVVNGERTELITLDELFGDDLDSIII